VIAAPGQLRRSAATFTFGHTMNKTNTLAILLILVFTAVSGLGQAKKNPTPKDYVVIDTSDDGATVELLPMQIGMTPNLTGAEIGIKYFGPQADSDLSFLLMLQEPGRRYYAATATFGVKLYSDDVPLSKNGYRLINWVKMDSGKEVLHFSITTEDLAWLASATSVKIEIYNSDTQQRLDTPFFTPTTLVQTEEICKGRITDKEFP